MTSLSV